MEDLENARPPGMGMAGMDGGLAAPLGRSDLRLGWPSDPGQVWQGSRARFDSKRNLLGGGSWSRTWAPAGDSEEN